MYGACFTGLVRRRLTLEQSSSTSQLAGERALLASVDEGRQMVQVRRTIEGCPRQVLHLKAKDLAGDLQELVSDANQT